MNAHEIRVAIDRAYVAKNWAAVRRLLQLARIRGVK
jgi:hypothetical protein